MPLTARVIPCVLLPTTSILLILTTRTVEYVGEKAKKFISTKFLFCTITGQKLRLSTVTNGPQTVCKNGQQFPAIVGNYAIPSDNLLLTTVTSM